MNVMAAKVLANCILGQRETQCQKREIPYRYQSQPTTDTFVKEVKNDMNYKAVMSTKKLVKDVLIPNLDPETAIINNFDPEAYPRGIADEEGEIIVKDEKLNKMFTTLAQTIPDYETTYGRPQHDMHQYTLDVHTFKVLKECINTSEYKNLSDDDKAVLQMAVILHDIAKPAWKNDREHPQKSAMMAENILDELDFPKETNTRIVDLIKNHGWFEFYNKGLMDADAVLEKMENKNDFPMLAIISKGDTKSVNDWFYDEYCTNLPNAIADINQKL